MSRLVSVVSLVALVLVAGFDAAAAGRHEDVEKARAAAAKNDRRVLEVVGSGDAVAAVKTAFEKDRDLRDKLLYEYDVVEREGDGAALRVTEPEGGEVARTEIAAFVAGGDVDEAALLAFLTTHQPARRSATGILSAAKKTAKAEGKRVFVHFGAPWCGNCHELEEWMARDDVRPLLEKEFVDCKIDIDRTKGGRRLLDRMRTGEPGGIPWFCFLSPEGETLVDSNRESDGKNVGFPRGEANHVHVRKMLQTGVLHLTPDEIDALIASLP